MAGLPNPRHKSKVGTNVRVSVELVRIFDSAEKASAVIGLTPGIRRHPIADRDDLRLWDALSDRPDSNAISWEAHFIAPTAAPPRVRFGSKADTSAYLNEGLLSG